MDALARLVSCGLTVRVERESSAVAPRGMVIAMSPASGTQADQGATVTIIVSDGPPAGDALRASPADEYRDANGWAITIPAGWQVAPFVDTQDESIVMGVVVSNTSLPAPVVVPGAPVQINSRDLPAHGIALTITVDDGPRPNDHPALIPPLDYPRGWLTSSSFPGTPYMRTSWFRVGSMTFAAVVKVSPRRLDDDLAAFVAAIRSIRAADTPQP
jgi:PASTA domain